MMYQYYFSIAGIKILLEIDHPVVKNKEFCPFLVEKTNVDICACIRKSEEFSIKTKQVIFTDKCYKIAVDINGKITKLFYETPDDPVCYAMSTYDPISEHISVMYLEAYERCVSELKNCFYLLGLDLILLNRKKICLHASCVETSLGGILFSGISGIGKSTQAELWCKYRSARQINGDRPVLSKENDGWMAWGSPYAGSSQYHVNDKCKIAAIVLLKQANSCTIRRLKATEAFGKIWRGLTVHNWDTVFVEKASALTIDLVTSVPIYEYSCTPDEEAVEYLEQILRKEISL